MKIRGTLIAGIVLLGFAAVASAQQQPLPPPPVSLTVPHPIPPISNLPLPPTDLYRRLTPPILRPGPIVPPAYTYGPSSYALYGYAFPWSDYEFPSYEYLGPLALPPREMGWLRLDTTPGDAQVFVDGYYVGQADDLRNGHVLDLDAGGHRIEVRAPGYSQLGFDVNIAPYESTRYRGDLQRLAAVPPVTPVPAPAPRKPTYIIPNCYAGDRPPVRPLPPGCDVKRLQTRN
jgi:hypothetical protein